MSNFAFLAAEWPEFFEHAKRAESLVNSDPRAACFYTRYTLERLVHWLYRYDPALRRPYQDNLSALIHEPTFKQTAGQKIFYKAQLIMRLGNEAVHEPGPVALEDALLAVRELFHVTYWLARTYARGARPDASLAFDPGLLPPAQPVAPQSREALERLEAELRERDEQLARLQADREALSAELERLRAEIAAAKKANEAQPDLHDYSEEETRDAFIDLLLREAGWALDQPRDREYPVEGMPNSSGKGYVDYVLWGTDGLPLAIVEAKKTRKDPKAGQQQAKLYADCLERQFGRRPVIFYTNGYEHWLWDDTMYPPRRVQGFYTRDELELLIQRRTSRKSLREAPINTDIVNRYYQIRAVRRVGEAFERDKERKALLVMATGTGKTRTAIALVDLLMRCNWAKRVLFLADRLALVNQAVGAFKKHLPDAAPVNLVNEKNTEGRVYVCTYPTMMNLIEQKRGGQRRFGVGHFDLIIIDEAHRSVFQKYRAIFEYFDALLLGLTATPKDEVDRNTYRLFDLEEGVPTDAYSYEEAVKDKFLVPFKAVSVPLKFQREGIKYDELPPEEKEQWELLDWGEGEEPPESISAQAINKWFFNADTVDKVLEYLMTRGIKVAGGDRLGKTIIFAKNHDHAKFIEERFNANYPHLKGEFARVIDFQTEYAQNLIDNFSNPDKPPHIAISVDMLDTGIDVPEVVNLVFFKIVRSKTKFWQMIGRGTRLCPDLFGPGRDKEYFYIFDFCQNLEFFSQNPEFTEGSVGESLTKRLFTARLELIKELDRRLQGGGTVGEGAAPYGDTSTLASLRQANAELLRTEIASMNPDNFIVRPKRRLVERYSEAEAWESLTPSDYLDLAEIAGLPSGLEPEPEESKRFDLLMLGLQLDLLRGSPRFKRLQSKVRDLVGLLEEKAAIPLVAAEMELILDMQTDAWWQGVTVDMLEIARRRLRGLIPFIDRQRRKPIYTDFEDEIGTGVEVVLTDLGGGPDLERFRAKARQFLLDVADHVTIRKLRTNRPLTATDLTELERMMMEAGVGSPEELEAAKAASDGLGLFIRSLVGLDREAAKRAFADFLKDSTATANQIEFVNLIIDHLTDHGVMDPGRLYESPFTDLSPTGPEGLFSLEQVDRLVSILREIRQRAVS